MLTTKRKLATVGEILVEEFIQPMGLTQAALAEAMGVQRKHVNVLCNDRRTVTAATALFLARVFGNAPDFWLNAQRRSDLWEAMNSPHERERIKRAKPLGAAAGSVTRRHRRRSQYCSEVADGVGFEPTNPCGLAVFKTAALNRSATHPAAPPSA